MGWISQQYEHDFHIVPDTEPGHVLSGECFCEPVGEIVNYSRIWVHRDQLDRMVAGQDLESKMI